MIANISRNFFLHASKNKLLNKAAKKWGLRLGASQVVAGTSIESMAVKVRQLNEMGLCCTLDHLGEFVKSTKEATDATNDNIKTLDAIAWEGLDSQLSVKLTQLGIDISKPFCIYNMEKILHAAKVNNNFVTIDMEDFYHCQQTLDILRHLRKKSDNVGTVIQAYLFRSEEDVRRLKGVPLRLVKGAYRESASVSYQQKKKIDQNFFHLISIHLLSGSYTAIATHDHHIIAKVKEFAEEKKIPRNQFEFQMLYGFRTDLRKSLVEEGYKMRVYVPYGNDWFAYYMRRLAERPQNVTFALRGLFLK